MKYLYQRLAVEILVSGFAFDEEDFVRPWEGQIDNLERYLLLHCVWFINEMVKSKVLNSLPFCHLVL
jgi:hypothetical protein